MNQNTEQKKNKNIRRIENKWTSLRIQMFACLPHSACVCMFVCCVVLKIILRVRIEHDTLKWLQLL